ncbi:MAG: pyruvate:ferredoxin (flavodoxin) oxidoreductase [Verrucomicrobia bacterium]|nr:MAG: pyruvate:ferredoxin (flavodoxin) oxidoreductase [Verrucomicrobiota bacterium]
MKTQLTIDANEAVANVAYALSEIIAIYPITPSSSISEWTDQWASQNRKNLWGTVPTVIEMQSEGGAAGALHGALQTGALATTFTSSQGLLLMIPNMYKIAGELTPAVIHVAARALATQALSIFGDHSDVMAARATGWGMLASNSPQEAQDMAVIAHAATLEARVPFLHFFDGFRTSHEVAKIQALKPEDLQALLDDELVRQHRARGLSPDHPFIRGTAQNPDVCFQAREAANPYYLACPALVQNAMDKFAAVVGRKYSLFDYVGHPEAERVVITMGSGAEVAHETIEHLVPRGEKVGLLKVRLFRPFSVFHFVAALPPSVEAIAVLDRSKEPGSPGEPLYLDVVTALHESSAEWQRTEDNGERTEDRGQRTEKAVRHEAHAPRSTLSTLHAPHAPHVIGGRYGLSSKEFTPAMVKAVLDELKKPLPKNHFTIGIKDDLTHTSLDFDPSYSTEDPDIVRAVFYGLGSDGTVGANKNSIKIIGEETDQFAQGYFVYDSKKSGSVTVSHLRFGPRNIRSSYLISEANFVACHQFSLLKKMDVLKLAAPGATFLLNSPHAAADTWEQLPAALQQQMIEKKIRFYVLDAGKVARQAGLGGRISTIMQTGFFALAGILPREEAIAAIKKAIQKTFGKRGEAIVQKNYAAVDLALSHLSEIALPEKVTSSVEVQPTVPADAPEFVRDVTAKMIEGLGDELPVSALPADGTYPSATTRWEKRNIALEIPVWDESICIQCGKCVIVCPHSAIRSKVYAPDALKDAPSTFKSSVARWQQFKESRFTLQVAPEDCTGCRLCVEACPVKAKTSAPTPPGQLVHKAINMAPQLPLREAEARNWDYFLKLPDPDRAGLNPALVKDVQLFQPLFEFSGACAGCGETPHLKLLSQLFGDRLVIANATGCSSIYGGNLPTTPWAVNAQGRGPAWSNSLFEDNAEFGLGMRLSLDKQAEHARELLKQLASIIGDDLVTSLLNADQSTSTGIEQQRERVADLKSKLQHLLSSSASNQLDPKSEIRNPKSEIRNLLALADALVKKSVWVVGGDGWAYDIGYGGLDHVLASGHKVNVLVLDTEVYSNTGGQMSKSTPCGAVAKFAAGGKLRPKKDLALMAMTYRSVYVARIALGANDTQALKAFLEAEAYDGPSLIISYGHCIAHGYDLVHGLEQQKAAVLSGHWPLIRYNPALLKAGRNPLQLDSKAPTITLEQYRQNESRYTMLAQSHPEAAREFSARSQQILMDRWHHYEYLAAMQPGKNGGAPGK